MEERVESFSYSSIEWRALSSISLDQEKSKKIIEILEALEELDDVQNVYINANLDN